MAQKRFAPLLPQASKRRRSPSDVLLCVALEVHDAPRLDLPIAQKDLESRCVQLRWSRGERPSTQRLIKPDGFVVTAEAAARHGITHVRAAADGEPLDAALRALLRDARAVVRDGGGIVCRPLDRAVLANESARCGLADLGELCDAFWLDGERFPGLTHASRSDATRAVQECCEVRRCPGKATGEHTPTKCYPCGPRDNGEFDLRCAVCGMSL